ncbi:MAG TPA: class I SAM-dependent methyltransferase [Pseudonocardiaceae bacterium]|nr:class I SAM-dependent methyltransferase [Pseudonocardiaceae bacterium]
MPFNHNDHYHPLLLRQVPAGARTALDVGCGTGRFARRLAAAGLAVTGVDASPEVINVARVLGCPGPGTISYRQADIRDADLPGGHYDFISCLASIHHVPFDTVRGLRAALAPGGVLVILGLAQPRAVVDYAKWLAVVPLNLAARLVVWAGERLNGGVDLVSRPPIRSDTMTMTDIRRKSQTLLPGRTVRPVLFWRYLLVYRAPTGS